MIHHYLMKDLSMREKLTNILRYKIHFYVPNLLRYMPIFILNSWHDSDVFFAVFHLLYPLFYTMLLESTAHLIRSHLFSQGNLRLEFQEIPTYFLASCFWLFLCIFAIIGNHASSFCLRSDRDGGLALSRSAYLLLN